MSAGTSARLTHRAAARRPLAVVLAGALVASGATIVVAAAAGPASAAVSGPAPVCSETAASCTVTFGYSGLSDTFTVPAGVNAVDLDLYGAQGGNNGYYNSSFGGRGGRTRATLPVAPGQQLELRVGRAGAPGGGATYGGGGAAGGSQSYLGSGGGGTFVFAASGDLLAAAGGGGGGGQSIDGGAGAGAGQNGGDGAVEAFWTSYGDSPARGGTQAAGGIGGRNETHFAYGTAGAGPANSAAPGQGGAGGYSPYNPYYSGAGGGGGYYGGGGGGAFHGGAGGSGYAAASLSDVTAQSGVRSGDGQVAVTYDRSPSQAALTVSPDAGSTEGDAVTLTAMTSSDAATPTGTVTFSSDGTPVPGCDAVPVDGQGQAQCTTSALTPGSRSLAAAYHGDLVTAPVTTTSTAYAVAYKPLVITTTTLPAGQVGQPYSALLDATGGHGPYTWDVETGSLPSGLTLSTAGVLSGTPTAVDSGEPVMFQAKDSQDHPYTDTQSLTVSVGKAAQTITVTSESPTTAVVGDTYTPVATSDSGLTVVPSVDAATTGSACRLDGAVVRLEHVGTCLVDFDQPGDADHQPADTVQVSIPVGVLATTTTVTPALAQATYGQPVTATTTVTAGSVDPAGTVQFAVDGHPVGNPVVLQDGRATSADLIAGTAPRQEPGAHDITATFTPTDSRDQADSAGATTVAVSASASHTELTLPAGNLRASLSAVAPGSGTPTGRVEFYVDQHQVGAAQVTEGVATLHHSLPAGTTHTVTALYSGDQDFTGSSGSTARHDPLLAAELRSPKPHTASGWYASPVTVRFTCTPQGAPLTGPCPAPVTLSHQGAGQSVTRTITSTDGGAATRAVRGISIDRTRPTVRIAGVRNGGTYAGAKPRPRCIGSDRLSGVASCTLHQSTHGPMTTLRARATDRAGNVAISTLHYRTLAYYVENAPLKDGVFQVSAGHAYTLVARSTSRPRYYDAAVTPRRPTQPDAWFHKAGHRRWVIGVSISRAMRAHHTWTLGIHNATGMHQLRIHLN